MHKQQGFTLVELMITMAILAILVTLGAIGFRELVLNNRREAFLSDFSGAVSLARSESIKRGRRVGLCMTTDAGGSCDGGGTAGYHQGWAVFRDSDTTFGLKGAAVNCTDAMAEDEDCLVKVYPPISGQGRFMVGAALATGWADRIIYFRSTGDVYFREGAVLQQNTPMSFVYCDPREKGTENRLVTVGPGLAVVGSVPGVGTAQTAECQ